MQKNPQSPIPKYKSAFTLVELSIVLVIIGLIVGGVLAGQDLIKSAQVRAQIGQIQQYQMAVNTFKEKYNYLPGDMPSTEAEAVGFFRSTAPNNTGCSGYYATGCGNGNEIIGNKSTWGMSGEQHLFWLDLSVAGFIPNSIKTFNYNNQSTVISTYLPPAKLDGHYIYVWSGGISGKEYTNYLTISGIDKYCDIGFGYPGGGCNTSHTMAVSDAYNIDQKIDDGLPQSGNVMAIYIGYSGRTCGTGSATQALWIGPSGGYAGGCWYAPATTAAVAGSDTTCYDNQSTSGQPQKYSMAQNGGAGRNCAISVKLR